MSNEQDKTKEQEELPKADYYLLLICVDGKLDWFQSNNLGKIQEQIDMAQEFAALDELSHEIKTAIHACMFTQVNGLPFPFRQFAPSHTALDLDNKPPEDECV